MGCYHALYCWRDWRLRAERGKRWPGLHVFDQCIRQLFVPLIVAGSLRIRLASRPRPEHYDGYRAQSGGSPRAAPPQPLDVVKSSVTRVLAAAGGGQQRVEARRVVEELFDFDEMCRRMLADHWQEGTAYQQGEFVRLFTELLERSYLSGLRSVPPAAITFLGETVNGSYAQVKSRIATSRFGETSVDYRLVDHDGRWAVYDVALDGVSLVSSYRSQFTSILRTSSLPAAGETAEPEPVDAKNEGL